MSTVSLVLGLWETWLALTRPSSRVDPVTNRPGFADDDWALFFRTGAWVVPVFVVAVALIAIGSVV